MIKQTKLVKFMLVVILIIPFLLLVIALVQTFILKNKQHQLINAKSELSIIEDELDKQEEIYNFKSSEEYDNERYKHEEYNNENYGNEGDINIIIK